jgi:polysaccharide chain length determinant protein (PEP-CTERM system associated)
MPTEVPYTLGDYLDMVQRRWAWLATVLPAAVLIAVYMAYTIEPLYKASGTILLEPSSIPADMIRTTVTTYAEQHIELVQRTVMGNSRLVTLIEKIDPYPDLTDLNASEKARLVADNTSIERVDPISLEPQNESTAFSMHYLNPDPDIAVAVAEELVDRFLSYNRESRVERATDNYEFLLAQSGEVSATIQELEHRLADFKTRYTDALPEAQARILASLDRTERDLDGLERETRVTREKISLLELQLNQVNPHLFDPAGDWRLELATMRAQLAEARQKYTPDHPTVRRLSRSIEAMSARAGLSEESRDLSPPDNPDYIELASQLDVSKQELLALQARANRAREQIAEYERNSTMAPEVEREYVQLQRDYQVAQERFREIEGSLSQARLAETLETQQRGERFTLVRSPYRPSSPDSPNRLGIILIGFVLGGGLAVGLAALLESSDPSIRSARDLQEITDIKPLGTVPYMPNTADKRKQILAWGAASLAFAVAIAFVGSTVAQAAYGG